MAASVLVIGGGVIGLCTALARRGLSAGMTLGPVTGRLAADIRSAVQPQLNPAPLSPDRYH